MKTQKLALLVVFFVVGCGGATGGEGTTSASGQEGVSLGRVDEGARCATEGRIETLVDLNQDGQADVRKVYLGPADKKILVCREADLNFDGTKDIFMFFDQTGQISRDEIDLDYDRQIDIISTYVKGKVIKQEIDTNSDGVIDRVRHLEADVPVRVEGDTDGDRRVDYWEYYQAGRLVRIGIDEDGDGRADSWSRDDNAEATNTGSTEETSEEEAPSSEAEGDQPSQEEES